MQADFLPKISKERKRELEVFCKDTGCKFKNPALLDLAFRHSSYSNENTSFMHVNNERLEFLGDSVLGLAVAAFLYSDMEKNPEGDLAKIKSNVVSEAVLAPIAVNVLHADKYLVLGKGAELSGGRTNIAILADTVEAVIGALYIDSGYKAAEKLVLSLIVPEIRKVQHNRGHKDYKTILQVYTQKKCGMCPRYELVKMSGPDHDRTFEVKVTAMGTVYGPSTGKSKKEAEQNAARLAIESLKISDED